MQACGKAHTHRLIDAVPLVTQDMTPVTGVTIEDMGHKMGLNGAACACAIASCLLHQARCHLTSLWISWSATLSGPRLPVSRHAGHVCVLQADRKSRGARRRGQRQAVLRQCAPALRPCFCSPLPPLSSKLRLPSHISVLCGRQVRNLHARLRWPCTTNTDCTPCEHGESCLQWPVCVVECAGAPAAARQHAAQRGESMHGRCAGVRVGRWALLDAFSSVARDGTFTSQIARPRDRFLRVADQVPAPGLAAAPRPRRQCIRV